MKQYYYDTTNNQPVLAIMPCRVIFVPYLIKVLLSIVLFFIAFRTIASAQCVAPTLSFNSPKLINGTDNQIGAVYLFPEVLPGVDAHVEIIDIVGGASLTEIDNTTGAGYYDAFQPYVLAGANDTSYLDWKITFKVAGSNTDTFLACLAVTAVDVDGNNKDLKEFVEAATPGSFAVDPFTNLTISFDGIRSKAEGQITTIPLIDTAERQAMFQMNFTNINSLLYRNGAITTGDTMTRQTCIYFKPFFSNWIVLPVKLLSFTAQPQANGIVLNWTTMDEQDIKNYTVQKSTDGKNWKNISSIMARGSLTNAYRIMDPEKNNTVTYFRLQQVSLKGFNTYSKIVMIGAAGSATNIFTHNTVFTTTITINIQAQRNEDYVYEIYTVTGNSIKQMRATIYAGINLSTIPMPENLPNGIYLLSVKNSEGRHLYNAKLIKQQN